MNRVKKIELLRQIQQGKTTIGSIMPTQFFLIGKDQTDTYTWQREESKGDIVMNQAQYDAFIKQRPNSVILMELLANPLNEPIKD